MHFTGHHAVILSVTFPLYFTEVYVPTNARKAGSILFYFDGDCNDPAVQTQIKKQFIEILKTSVFKDVCIDKALKEKCNATNVAVECGKKTRRKRTIGNILQYLVVILFHNDIKISELDACSAE